MLAPLTWKVYSIELIASMGRGDRRRLDWMGRAALKLRFALGLDIMSEPSPSGSIMVSGERVRTPSPLSVS